MTTTKKMMLKISPASVSPSITGKVASQIGIAPRSPAQPSITRSRSVKRSVRLATAAASGRATKISTAEISRPSPATSTSWLGKTSRPSRKKSEICETQPRPWWKATIVRLPGTWPVPRISAVR